MQNNYVKELAIKTYQEEPEVVCVSAKQRSFHTPSFFSGILFSAILIAFIY
ncbi:hypothetical protein [Vibrio sp. F74]|uniref:hypothetical protein n=1 Tax=Vibrio sp. F74 TaxID=700020 RepID=UPI0035F5A092